MFFAFWESRVVFAAAISRVLFPGPATRTFCETMALCLRQLGQVQFHSPLIFPVHDKTRDSSRAHVSFPDAEGPENNMEPGSLSFSMSSDKREVAL